MGISVVQGLGTAKKRSKPAQLGWELSSVAGASYLANARLSVQTPYQKKKFNLGFQPFAATKYKAPSQTDGRSCSARPPGKCSSLWERNHVREEAELWTPSRKCHVRYFRLCFWSRRRRIPMLLRGSLKPFRSVQPIRAQKNWADQEERWELRATAAATAAAGACKGRGRLIPQ